MRWNSKWAERAKWRPFFALIPHYCGQSECEVIFWLERGYTRKGVDPMSYVYTDYACAEHTVLL